MSGICDMCRRTTCEYRADDIAVCGLPKTETNYERLFGTPERAAQTICRQLKHFNICICDGCPVKPPNKECNGEYDALLEWMRGEA